MGNLTRHFNLEEFYVSTSRPELAKKMARTPADEIKCFYLCQLILEPIRLFIGKPIQITSGKRDKALNAAVGGVPTSSHRWIKRAVACDFKFINGTKEDHKNAFEYAIGFLKQTVGEMIFYFRPDMSHKHLHVSLADGKDRSEFMLKRGSEPFELFNGTWPS